MTSHRYHPDPERNDPPDAVLFDDCERCAERSIGPSLQIARVLRERDSLTVMEAIATASIAQTLSRARNYVDVGWSL